MKGKFENHAFGCDICQEVCPWNRFSLPTKVDEFKPTELLFGMKQRDWLDMTQEVFDKVFEQSPIHRTGLKGMQRNVNFLRLKGGSSN